MGSFVNDGDRVSIVCEDAITEIGQVVTLTDAAAGKCKLVDADGEIPYGVALMTTEDPLNKGTYLTNQTITVIKSGVVICQVASDAADTGVNVGSPFRAETDDVYEGVVGDFTVVSGPQLIQLVGYATEGINVTAGTIALGKATIKLRLCILGS